jgi:hypothetical protein
MCKILYEPSQPRVRVVSIAPVVSWCYHVKMPKTIIEPWHGAADAGLCAANQEMYKVSMATEFRNIWHV